VIVASNFLFRWVQPSKERAHPRFELQGETDGTCEVPEEIDREEVKRCLTLMFNLMGHLHINDKQRPFSVGNLPPWVRIFLFYYFLILMQ
jgi:hypothetical protein